jgi:hypothetical protein
MMNRHTLGILTAASTLAVMGCGTTPEFDPIEETNQELSGTYYLIAQSSLKCLDVPNGKTSSGLQLNQWACHVAANQQWSIKKLSNGNHQLTPGSSPTSGSLCADVSGASVADHGKVIQWPCSTTKTNQQWKLLDTFPIHRLQSIKSGKCMTVVNNSPDDGALIEQMPCVKGAKDQQFKFSGAPSGGTGGSGGSGGGGSGGSGGGGDLVWRKANLTNFTSYPDPGSDECIMYNGCMWAGQFAFVDGKQPESWVKAHNIIAIHSKDANAYRLKTLRLRQGGHEIEAVVYDECADSDCSGCCTANSKPTGFLIDIEKYTMQRFGSGDGIVDWACTNCK